MKLHKEIIVLFFALSLASSSCSQQNTTESDSIAQRNLVSQFFTWYIKEAGIRGSGYYQVPGYKKLSQTSYIFDINDLKKRLDKISFFSEAFKTKQVEKLKFCNTEMQKISWDSEPESQFNIRACDYLWYDNWIGGQGEDIDGFNIVSENLIEGGIEFVVEILIKKKKFTKSRVIVVKENEKYKIDSIELDWN